MLSVSNAWKNMFNNNLVGEALIKFDIENYGTLYKTDIFSYEFRGQNHFLCDIYPQYNATIKAVMRNLFYDFNYFKRKKVEIYYGFVINGSNEYVKAQTLYIDNISVSDDGRVATIELKSGFAYLTETLKNQTLYTSYPSGSFTWFLSFYSLCNDVFGSGNWIDDSGLNKNVRFLPSKITSGNAIQSLAFANGRFIKLQSDGKYFLGDQIKSVNTAFGNKLNILKYPHYTTMEYPTSVVVDWFDVENAVDYQISNIGSMFTFNTSYHPNPLPSSRWGQGEMDFDNENVFLLWGQLQYTAVDFNDQQTPMSYTSASLSIYNDKISFYYKVDVSGHNATIKNINIRGYNFRNRYEIIDEQVSIFDINFNDQAHANAIQSRVADYLSSQKEVELDLRFDPSIELLDLFYFNGLSPKKMIVEELKITFNGSYRGQVKGRYDDLIIKPDVDIDHYSDHDFTFYVENLNPFPVDLYIEYSGGEVVISMSANEFLEINNNDYPELLSSFQAKAYQDLQEEVYCWFETQDGDMSDNVIILEAD